MNNKGQSLILFILLIPVIFLILMMVYDIGSMVLLKNELNDINYMAINYGIDHISDDDIGMVLQELIVKNKSDVVVSVNVVDDKLYIELTDSIDNKLSLFNKIDIFSVKSSYVGYMEDEKKIIKKNK